MSQDATTSAASTANAETPEKQARKAYRAPLLVRLGSVRELTLGKTSGFAEGGGTFLKPTM